MNPHTISEYPLVIREQHLDTFGHVNNATYLQILEEARWEIITQNGFGLDKIREGGVGPVILEVHLMFLRELRLRQTVTIRTQLESYEGKIAKLKQWIVNDKSEVCCEAVFKIALFDTRTRKMILPTREWMNALGVI